MRYQIVKPVFSSTLSYESYSMLRYKIVCEIVSDTVPQNIKKGYKVRQIVRIKK